MSEYETFINKAQSMGRKITPRYIPHVNFPKLKTSNIFIDDEHYISSDDFLHNGYSTMLVLHGYNRFSQIVFDMIWNDLAEKNIQQLEIKEPYIFDSLYIRLEDGKIPYSLSTDSFSFFYHTSEKGQTFIDNFIHSVKNSFIFALDITIDYRNVVAHQNVCLFYKKGNNIHLFLYEPHGSGSINYTVFRFVNFLKMSLRNEDLNIVHEWDDQIYYNPIGNQTIGEDREGYCVMYTYFWLYLVLKSVLETGSTEYIKDMETIISYYFKGRQLHDIIKNFSQKFFNYYFSQVKIVDFERHFMNMLKVNKYNIHTVKRSNYQKEEKYIESKADSFVELFKARDGRPCENDSDCFSDNCERGICTPYNYYKPGPLPASDLGDYCEKDCECKSGYCDKENNVCSLPLPEYEELKDYKDQNDWYDEEGDWYDEEGDWYDDEEYDDEEYDDE